VLQFQGMERAFGGFDNEADADRFQQRLKNYLSIWCCVDSNPGHVW
jgi:hypothetical protein